ncbi:acyl-CoA carboxylase subunit epsilon [Corynebacterium sp. MC-17D]|uniref:Acyl-CoA carboxylase subunit epsilon n=1 Tax=Corynebacterium lipophilum TaxID=2804918 RepID=A0AAW5HVN0_9CORY|nr:acyl-CoA carboxylase epsilon subunit [Corynebacterium lipophilum]MCO6393776.1 acyl-CoA carboxylase subunit epsilon [Corynebacterium lipophilum]MCZ2116329.1 acyl-CoA carboxylase subunit epsilon [Corynebacterium lipophilum]
MSSLPFDVVKGNPSPEEVEALRLVLEQLQQQAQAAKRGERNVWGVAPSPVHAPTLFNPLAFSPSTYS